MRSDREEDNRNHKHGRLSAWQVIRRILSVFLILIFLFLMAFFGAATVVCYGPSEAARDLYVSTVMETSAAKFLARMYFSDADIREMTQGKTVRAAEAVTDTAAVSINTAADEASVSSDNEEDMYVEDINEQTFRGKLLVVKDPSRVSIYSIGSFNTEGTGKQLINIINETGAVAGINAGGFYDPDGKGRGGMPLGPVIKDGVLISNYECDYSTLIGFDAQHRLIVGNMSAESAIAAGMVDGICFGPALVVNGERVPISGSGGGLNPRTAIGQKSDGTMLLMVIDGRQPSSLGASYKDLTDEMLKYGAVNAANLDGGSSSVLYYQGELINSPSSMIGMRPIPTAIIVK